jgi:hypothetical protein
MVVSEIIDRINYPRNRMQIDNLTNLISRVMVTEKAVGEEASYVFLSVTIEEGKFQILNNYSFRRSRIP